MPQNGVDSWQTAFFFSAIFIVVLMAWRGWRMGVVRQVVSLLAIGLAYLVGWFAGPFLVVPLRPLGMPDSVLGLIGGVILGLLVFIAVTVLGMILFKKTSQQSVTLVRLGYGFSGAVIGGVFGFFLVWLSILAIRVLGTFAESEIEASKHETSSVFGQPTPRPAQAKPSAWVRGLAEMKHALERGSTGNMVSRVDPVPDRVYGTLTKIGHMMSNEQSMAKFMTYPGVHDMMSHPKVVALNSDNEIREQIAEYNFVGLLRHPKLVSAANDPDVAALLKKFELEKALDYALEGVEKQPAKPLKH